MEIVYRRFANPRAVLAALFLIVGIGAAAPASSVIAQDGPDLTTTFTINVLTCIEPGCSEFIEDTAPTEGVAVEVSTPEGSLGSCVTGSTGACSIDIEWFPTVTMTFDESTIPEGYSLTSNPEQWPMGEEPQAAVSASVLLFPDGGFLEDPEPTEAPTQAPGDPEPPVAQLPSTGTGSNSGSSAKVLTGAVLLAIVLGTMALASRRTGGRQA